MTRLIRRSALVICILAVAAQASAEVVLLSQSRSVSVAVVNYIAEPHRTARPLDLPAVNEADISQSDEMSAAALFAGAGWPV